MAILASKGASARYRMVSQVGERLLPDWSKSWMLEKDRNPDDAWALDAWRDWFERWVASPELHRERLLIKLEKSSPGMTIRRMPDVEGEEQTACRAVQNYAREMLHDAGLLACADVASALAGTKGNIYFRPTLMFDITESEVNATFAVEIKRSLPSVVGGEIQFKAPMRVDVAALAVVRVLDTPSALEAAIEELATLDSMESATQGFWCLLAHFDTQVMVGKNYLVAPINLPYLRLLAYSAWKALI